MVESVERSRKKWINEGIFERYWTKPTKKKGVSNESPDNPPKDSMTKLGQCTITIEPHIFDVMMYAVKDTSKTTQPLPQTMHRPVIQYGPQPQPQSSQAQAQFHNMQAGPQGVRPQDNYNQSFGNAIPSANHPSGPPQMAPSQPLNTPTPQQAHPQPTPAAAKAPLPPAPAPAEPTPAPAKSSDPVIQMLAERAATDQELKALMRIVADGKASPEELRKFQGHIDELTKHVNMRLSAAPEKPSPHQSVPQPSAQTTNYLSQSSAPNTVSNGRPAQPSQVHSGRPMQPSPVQHGNSNYHLPPQPQALRSKGPLPPTKPDISAVCFEFIGGSGDRFLFPKYSILEFGPAGSVIASFLIVRKGSSADAKSYDPKLDYYQPVTIRLYAHQSRQLDNLQKVVAPQEEVRKYMDDIMDNMTRAEYVLLAMQLPREEERPQVPEDVPMQNGYTAPNGVLWTTPASTGAAISQKPAKRQLTEGQQHHNFMASVS